MNIEVISFSRIAEKIIAHTPEALKPRVDDGGRAAVEAVPGLDDGRPAWAVLLAATAVRMLAAGRRTR